MIACLKMAENIIEEMKILSMDQCQKVGLGAVGIGSEHSRFILQTGENFLDCDILGMPSFIY